MTQISKEYANALFSIAAEKGCVRPWAEQLAGMAQAMADNPAYLDLLASPEIPPEERAQVLRRAFAGAADEEILSFGALMCRRGRARELPDAISRFRQMADEAEHVRTARVISARPLTADEEERLRAQLEKNAGGTVVLRCEVDASLLGGLIVEMDGRVTDGSLRARLSEIKEVIGG